MVNETETATTAALVNETETATAVPVISETETATVELYDDSEESRFVGGPHVRELRFSARSTMKLDVMRLNSAVNETETRRIVLTAAGRAVGQTIAVLETLKELCPKFKEECQFHYATEQLVRKVLITSKKGEVVANKVSQDGDAALTTEQQPSPVDEEPRYVTRTTGVLKLAIVKPVSYTGTANDDLDLTTLDSAEPRQPTRLVHRARRQTVGTAKKPETSEEAGGLTEEKKTQYNRRVRKGRRNRNSTQQHGIANEDVKAENASSTAAAN